MTNSRYVTRSSEFERLATVLSGDILRLSAQRHPRKTALIGPAHEMSFCELDRASNQFSHALLEFGIEKGERVAVMCPNIPEYGVFHFGAARTGCVQVHLSVMCGSDEITQILNRTGARLIVVDAEFLPAIETVRGDLAGLERVIVIGGADEDSLENFIAGKSETPPDIEINENDPLGMTFTGGTTGLPKGAVVSHRARYVSAYSVAFEHELTGEDVCAALTPLYHAVGLFIWFQAAMLAGCTTVMQRRWDTAAFVDACAQHGITAAMTVPVQLRSILSDQFFDAEKLVTFRKIGCGGANVSAEIIAEGRKKLPGVKLIDHYGQSETGLLTVLKPWHPADKNESIGLPAIGVDLRVLDSDGKEVKPGEIGEVVIKGDFLFDGYFDNPEETATYFKHGDGWGWTGDLATIDEDGFVTLAGRSKDMIISGGINIYPREVEIVLEDHDAVAECTVFGVPDDKWGEALIALVVARDNAMDDLPDLLSAYCSGKLARFKCPREILMVAEIPKTPAGKIQKPKLRDDYLDNLP
jgi:acyl-CoA synthetase (AMP-forming)/AMP-acid ligase II